MYLLDLVDLSLTNRKTMAAAVPRKEVEQLPELRTHHATATTGGRDGPKRNAWISEVAQPGID